MALTIPLRNDLPNFDLEVTLEGRTFRLVFYWNTREGYWYMDVYDSADVEVVTSIKVVIDFPLGFRTKNPAKPSGCFFAVDTSGERRDPSYDPVTGRGDLGDRVVLMYVEASEMPVTV